MTGRSRKGSAGERYANIVRDALAVHVARGVLRKFEERPARGGKIEFRFTWLLDQPFLVVLDIANSRIVLKDLLPHIPARSFLDKSIREFVAGRSEKTVPAHRRIDRSRLEVLCQNRKSALTFVFRVKRNQYGYAVPKVLNFCNELFGFLDMKHIQYLWDHFGVPEE